MIRVSIVVVNTNHCDLLRQCLTALGKADLPDETEIIVVDNNSQDGSAQMVEREFATARLIRQTIKNGPAVNYNAGFAVARGEFLVVLNEDAEVTPDALLQLYNHMLANPLVAIVGPRLTYPDGRSQACCNRFPGFSSVFKRLILQSFIRGTWVKNQYCEEVQGQAFEPDWIMATSLMIRKAAIEQVGRYDEQFVVYYEELDLCRRLRASGWTVAWLPDAVVRHHHGISNITLRGERDIAFRALLYQSRYRYFRKHYGRIYAGAIRFVEAALFFTFFLKTTLESLIPARRQTAALKATLYRMLTCYALSGRGCVTLPQN